VNIFVHITSVASIYILTKFFGHYKEPVGRPMI